MSFYILRDHYYLKDKIKQILILIYALCIFYFSYFKKIPTLYSTILFIILGTIILIRNWPVQYAPLFKTMNNDDLNKFKDYLTSNNLKVSNIHKLEYFQGKTPIMYAIDRRAFNIFKYLIENNYDLSYISKNSEPVITFAAHSGELKYLNLLLKHKDKFDLYAKNTRFNANALEILVWRGENKLDSIEALLNAGMKFSINDYNNTIIGKQLCPFKDVPLDIKKILVKRCIFEKNINQINIVDELDKKKNMKFFNNINIYWKEFLDFA